MHLPNERRNQTATTADRLRKRHYEKMRRERESWEKDEDTDREKVRSWDGNISKENGTS